MSEDHDRDPYTADPPRDSRDCPPFLDAMKQLNQPTVKVTTAFCIECDRALAAHEVKCVNCHGDKPTGFK